MRSIEPLILHGMFALALVVQLGVYCATKIRSSGALLGDYAHYFGVPYALGFLAFQVWYCHAYEHRRGFLWIAAVCIVSVLLIAAIGLLRGSVNLTVNSAFALTAGISAMALWAGVTSDRI